MRRIFDKNRKIIHVTKRLRNKTNTFDLGKNSFQINLSNLNNTEVTFNRYYQLVIPLRGSKGNLTAFKSWIVNDKFTLLQSLDEDFIREINSGIREFMG
jgi:hypothetical protein